MNSGRERLNKQENTDQSTFYFVRLIHWIVVLLLSDLCTDVFAPSLVDLCFTTALQFFPLKIVYCTLFKVIMYL